MQTLILTLALSLASAVVAWFVVRSSVGPAPQAGAAPIGDGDFRFVPIAPGTFQMGDPTVGPSDDYDEHAHTVTLTRAFRMAACPVTIDQFSLFVQATKYKTDAERAGRGQGRSRRGLSWFKGMTWRSASAGLPGDTPVTVVSWNDAVAFCAWASKRTNERIRLPTEAEWEYACRAGTTGKYNARGPATDLGWFADNSGERRLNSGWLYQQGNEIAAAELAAAKCRPRPVGQLRPNAWGLFDMHGNVWQWCDDSFGPYPDGPAIDPVGPADINPTFRCARCASWCDSPGLGTSYNRGRWTPNVGYNHIGFRVVAEAL